LNCFSLKEVVKWMIYIEHDRLLNGFNFFFYSLDFRQSGIFIRALILILHIINDNMIKIIIAHKLK